MGAIKFSDLPQINTPAVTHKLAMQAATGTYGYAELDDLLATAIPGNFTTLTVSGNSTLGGLTGLTVASGGASITGNSTVTGTLMVTGTTTLGSGSTDYGTVSGGSGVFEIAAAGASSDVQINYRAKGGGAHTFSTGGTVLQLAVTHTASANRYVTITGSNGGNPSIGVSGGELSIGTNSWTLGSVNSVSPTSPNRTLTVTVGGTTYYVHAKTTND